MGDKNPVDVYNPAEPMRCYSCDGRKWHKVGALRGGKPEPIHSETTVQVCMDCGTACHSVDVSKEEAIKQFYRKEYRPQPGIMNLVTTSHKINYIRTFLRDYLEENKGRKLIVGDMGSATGYVLNFFKSAGHRVSGAELTLTYRRMSEHYYGIPVAEELETKHKYDLIVIYHVLEHLFDPDKKLAHYASLLAEGGKILLATPEFLSNDLEDASGVPVKSFDYLFHKNHVNLFTRTSLQNVIRKCGLTVVKEDYVQYGQTYLLERRSDHPVGSTPTPPTDVESWLTKEDWREVVRTMQAQEHAIALHVAGEHRKAVEAFPRFPEAWLAMVFGKYSKDMAKQVDLMREAEPHVGHNMRFKMARAQWLFQHGRMAESVDGFQEVLSVRPSEDLFMHLGYALAQTGRSDEAMRAFGMACAMDPRKWPEAQGWMLNIASGRPTWDERALAEAGKVLRLEPAAQPGAAQ